MKKKYTVTIADVEMNILTDAPAEAVEKIVGMLDRRMRDIHLKSNRCTKNQAALLCALEYCSEKLGLQERNEELEALAEQDAETLEQKDARIAELEGELSRVQGENEIMHGILERAAASTERIMGHTEQTAQQKSDEPKVAEAQPEVESEIQPEAAPETTPEVEPEQQAPEQLSVDFEEAAPEEPVNTKAAQVIEEIASEEAAVPKVKAKKTKSRSRVGSMFDLLTFNDV